ncbi:hypothetical protein AVEN_181365-1 [Araneus ventricosus]|uniref:Uncharacterized protein n=1 Tax=Araneus ventricosus TaxID=182803 RepID=A0A4Y2HR85_ARAVE|nr:hypothetical protein AVEN_181365-1 [Araneus ventricosus]
MSKNFSREKRARIARWEEQIIEMKDLNEERTARLMLRWRQSDCLMREYFRQQSRICSMELSHLHSEQRGLSFSSNLWSNAGVIIIHEIMRAVLSSIL